MDSLCQDRVVVITGAGRGIGREEALEFARQGAKVIVNDLGGARDGTGAEAGPAQEVVEEIKAMGGEAVANTDDVSDWEGAGRMITQAVDTFGGLDVLVNNAGILRDRMLANMTIEEWDAVIKVHLRGTFCPARHAAGFWRERAKEGKSNDARIINTTSVSGLFGNVGQSNYGAAKAGIASFTIIAAQELARYGVTVNAFSPGALTRMTEDLMPGGALPLEEDAFDPRDPATIVAPVVWFGSVESKDITGQVFEGIGGRLSLYEGWHRGPAHTFDRRLDPMEIGPIMERMVKELRPPQGIGD